MPATEVLRFKDDDGSLPVLDWLNSLLERNQRAYRKCRVLITMLEEQGHELRRLTPFAMACMSCGLE